MVWNKHSSTANAQGNDPSSLLFRNRREHIYAREHRIENKGFAYSLVCPGLHHKLASQFFGLFHSGKRIGQLIVYVHKSIVCWFLASDDDSSQLRQTGSIFCRFIIPCRYDDYSVWICLLVEFHRVVCHVVMHTNRSLQHDGETARLLQSAQNRYLCRILGLDLIGDICGFCFCSFAETQHDCIQAVFPENRKCKTSNLKKNPIDRHEDFFYHFLHSASLYYSTFADNYILLCLNRFTIHVVQSIPVALVTFHISHYLSISFLILSHHLEWPKWVRSPRRQRAAKSLGLCVRIHSTSP